MSYDLNGVPIRSGAMTIPYLGAWQLSVALDATRPPPTGKGVVTLGDTTWQGFIYRADVFAGTVSCRVIGGMGGFDNLLKPKEYQGATVRQVLKDMLGQVDESISSDSPSAQLDTKLPYWSLLTEPCGTALSRLERTLNRTGTGPPVIHFVKQDGTTYFGEDPNTNITTTEDQVRIVKYHITQLVYDVAMLAPYVVPHTVWNGKDVDRVTLEIHPDGLRGNIFFSEGAS